MPPKAKTNKKAEKIRGLSSKNHEGVHGGLGESTGEWNFAVPTRVIKTLEDYRDRLFGKGGDTI